MNVAIILNGISKKKVFYQRILPQLKEKLNVSVFETQFAGQAIELATSAADGKFNCILAAGGDGTLNQVLNGILKNRNATSLPTFGIIPLGTGNDFSKLCNIKPDANQILNLIIQNSPKPTDVGAINCNNEKGEMITRYFINACSLGMGPEVVKRLMKNNRSLGPMVTYLKAIIVSFFGNRPEKIYAKTPHWEWCGKMRVMAIANGKSFGNSMFIAPDASPDDGKFATFIAGELALLKFLIFLQKIKTGKKIKDTLVLYNECSTIEITAPKPCAIEADGEGMGWLPMKVEMMPSRVMFLR